MARRVNSRVAISGPRSGDFVIFGRAKTSRPSFARFSIPKHPRLLAKSMAIKKHYSGGVGLDS
jgi:hypothetical protein